MTLQRLSDGMEVDQAGGNITILVNKDESQPRSADLHK